MNILGESHEEKQKDSLINRLLGIIENLTSCDKKRQIQPILVFTFFVNNKNFNFMSIVTNLTLTSVAPVTLNMVVGDANNNNAPIAGVLSNLTYNVDATQDIAVVDSANPLEVDIHAVSLQGGSTVTATGTFVSTALQADGKTLLFSGTVTGTLVLVNNISVVVLNPVLTFNQ
jgi:hypothetical protein